LTPVEVSLLAVCAGLVSIVFGRKLGESGRVSRSECAGHREAMDAKLDRIEEKIDGLSKLIDARIDGMNRRLDRLNGA